MAKGGITGDIVHSVGARFRVRGAGYLRSRMWNMDNERYEELDNISMSNPSSREKTVLANFQDQGLQIQFRTIHIDEVFTVSKITCFVKPVAESYPIKSGG
jgi:hypothetical protein